MKAPEISIVIVNYNVKDLLLTCLETVFKYVPSSLLLEVIVVDNNSYDDSLECIRQLFPQVIIIENKFNAGFSGANNQGMEIAKGEYVFLLNPDTEIDQDVFSPLVQFMQEHVECAIIGPQLLNSDRSVQISTWKNHHYLDLIFETFYLNRIYNRLNYNIEELNSIFETKALSGAALFFRRKLVDEMGMLDPLLFWMEDIDFCFRAQEFGSVMYLNSTQVIHHSGQSQKKNYNVSISNQLLSKLKYYKKHFSTGAVFLANLSCLIFIVSRIVMFFIFSPFKVIYRLKLKAYIYTLNRYFKYIFMNYKQLNLLK
jgi:GT2 family glycosyltransferase